MKEILLMIVIMSTISCNNATKNNETSDNSSDSVKTIPPATVMVQPDTLKNEADSVLKDRNIDQEYFDNRTASHNEIQKNIFDALHLEKIPGLKALYEDPATKIKIIDTFLYSSNAKLLVIAAKTENESWAWLVGYDNNNTIASQVKIYYEDFVEYFSKTTTQIKANTIFITTETTAEDSKTKKMKKFTPGDGGKLELLK